MSFANLSNKRIVVTGSSSGIGRAIVLESARAGADVVISYRRSKAAAVQVALEVEELGREASVFQVDISERLSRHAFVEQCFKFGPVDAIVNNAGAGVKIAPAAEQTDYEIAASIDVNLTGAIYGCRRAAPLIVKAGGGTIVNISSVCAHQAWPGWSTYSAAKAGLEQFSKCLYLEHREQGLRVTSIAPSWGATSFSE